MQIRSFLLPFAVACLPALPALAQTDFQYQPYTTPGNAGIVLTAPYSRVYDFNGDGLADVLAASTETCSGNTCTQNAPLYLYMNNGDGGLKAPVKLDVTLQQPAYDGVGTEVAVADFNGDGKLDIAALNNAGGITILYGKGDGTFQAPVNIALPSAGSLGYASLVEADFDDNGTQDLAAMTYTGKLVLLFNNGKGTFTQQSVTIDTPPSGVQTTSLTVGDFNADGRPDIAWVELNNNYNSTDNIEAALNTGKGVFSAKHQVGTLPGTTYNFAWIRSADVDLDGKSDIVAWQTQLVEDCCSATPVMVYYSNGNGTFTATTVASTSTDDVGVADINGDGNPDILIAGYQGVQVYTGNGNRTFTDQGTYTSLPGGAAQLGFGFFDNNSNAIGFAAPNESAYADNDPDDFYLVQNDNVQGDCAYPDTPGVTFCQATQTGDTAMVRGTARAATGPVQHIELWANGKKMYQVFADEFNATLNVAPGTQITAIEVEANGATKSATVTPTKAACSAPSSPGVTVCSPTQGEVTTSPVTFTAAGTGASGTVNHLELWVDGTKIGNYSGATMNASVTLASGSHTATVIEVDSKGADVKSTPVSFKVGSEGACTAPSSPGVHVCSPTPGETTSSPVTLTAAGKGASGAVNHLELWVDGKKIGNYSGATMNANVALAAGSHSATVIEVDSKGAYVKSSPVSFTVK